MERLGERARGRGRTGRRKVPDNSRGGSEPAVSPGGPPSRTARLPALPLAEAAALAVAACVRQRRWRAPEARAAVAAGAAVARRRSDAFGAHLISLGPTLCGKFKFVCCFWQICCTPSAHGPQIRILFVFRCRMDQSTSDFDESRSNRRLTEVLSFKFLVQAVCPTDGGGIPPRGRADAHKSLRVCGAHQCLSFSPFARDAWFGCYALCGTPGGVDCTRICPTGHCVSSSARSSSGRTHGRRGLVSDACGTDSGPPCRDLGRARWSPLGVDTRVHRSPSCCFSHACVPHGTG